MIHLQTAKGRYFFSSVISITSDSFVLVDESELQLPQIKELLIASETGRLIISQNDQNILKSLLGTASNAGSSSVIPSQVDYASLEEVSSLMDRAISQLIAGAPAAYDTFGEIATWIGKNTNVKVDIEALEERTSALESKDLSVKVLTQSEYDNLVVKSNTTLYLISE